MRLDAWLEATPAIDREAFAKRLGITSVAVRRYELGERMPAPEIATAIIRETKAQVTAQDILETRMAFLRRQKRSRAA